MRINKLIAVHTTLSRRAADQLVAEGRVTINDREARIGQSVQDNDAVSIDGKQLARQNQHTATVKLNKPTGYVCSRRGQGAPTIFQLLPASLQSLQPAGRLDKDSSGLIILSSDGDLLQRLTHPRFNKQKVYQVELNKPLKNADEQRLKSGVELDDGLSRMRISTHANRKQVQATLSEGRNRQIRRTFKAIGYDVVSLHRTSIDDIQLGSLKSGAWQKIET